MKNFPIEDLVCTVKSSLEWCSHIYPIHVCPLIEQSKKGDCKFVKIKPPHNSNQCHHAPFHFPLSHLLIFFKTGAGAGAELFFASHPVPAVLFTLKKCMYEQQICSRKIHYCAVYMP